MFTGGLGAHYGGEHLGAAVIPVSGGFTERQVQLINDFKPDIIMVTQSYMLAIADEVERIVMEQDQIDGRGKSVPKKLNQPPVFFDGEDLAGALQ